MRTQTRQLLRMVVATAAISLLPDDSLPAPARGPAAIEICGTVVDQDGEAVEHAVVLLHQRLSPFEDALERLMGTSSPPLQRTASDRAGRFRLVAESGGPLSVVVSHHDGRRSRVELPGWTFESTQLDPIELKSTARSVLRLEDAAGQPIAGARIMVRSWRNSGQTRVPHARSNATGEASVEFGRNHYLDIVVDGFVPRRVQGHGPQPAVIHLRRGQHSRLIVRDSSGQPAAGALVFVSSVPAARTDVEGKADLWLPTTGNVELHVLSATHESAEVRIDLTDNPTTTQRSVERLVQLQPADAWRGRIIESGGEGGVSDALVWLRPTDVVLSDQQGRFTLPFAAHSPRGMWSRRLFAAGPSHALATVEPRGRADEIEIELHRVGVLRGQTVTADGAPVAGAVVLASSTAGRVVSNGGHPRVWTDADGRFQLPRVQLGTEVQVTARATGLVPTSVTAHLPVTSSNQPAPPELVLTMLGTLTVVGTVVDESERPVAGAAVQAFTRPAAANHTLMRTRSFSRGVPISTTTDELGRFALEEFAPGVVDLVVVSEALAPAEIVGLEIVRPDPANVAPADALRVDIGTVSLAPGALLSGSVVDMNGTPIPKAHLQLRESRRSSTPPILGKAKESETAADGRFRFQGLSPLTSYRIEFEADGFVPRVMDPLEAEAVEANPALQVVLQQRIEVTGRVLDEEGVPLEAQVRAWRRPDSTIRSRLAAPRGESRASSSADGTFRLAELYPGSWRLFADAPGYVRQSALIDLAADLEPPALTLTLAPEPRTAILRGRVTDSNGEPIAGVSVHRLASTTINVRAGGATTGTDGSYLLERIPEGDSMIVFEASGFQSLRRTARVELPEGRLDASLEPAFVVRGLVLDSNERPVAGATVTATHATSSHEATSTDEDGAFVLALGTRAHSHLRAAHQQLGVGLTESPIRIDGEVDGVVIRLGETGTIRGVIEGLDLDQLSRTRVWASGPTPNDMAAMDASYDGSFELEALVPGRWVVTAVPSDRGAQNHAVTVAAGNTSEVVLTFEDGYSLTGTVHSQDIPLRGASVSATKLGTSGGARDQTNQRGRFELKGLAAGTYRVEVSFGGTFHHELELELDADRDVDIPIEEAPLTIRLTDAGSGEPISEARAGIVRLNRHGGSTRINAETSDERGILRFGSASPGNYVVRITAQGYAATSAELALEAARTDPFEIPLAAANRLELTVLADGFPAWTAQVAVLDGRGRVLAELRRSLDEFGRAQIENLPQGPLSLLVGSRGRAAVISEVDVSTSSSHVVDLPLAAPVHVEHSSWSPDSPETRLLVVDSDGRLRRPPFMAQRDWTPLAFGRATIDHLPAGTYEFVVQSGDGDEVARTMATLLAGHVNRVVLDQP